MGIDIYTEIAQRAEQKKLCEKFVREFFPTGAIKLLIVGASSPIRETYFYIPEDLRKKHRGLPARVFRALFGATTKIGNEQCEKFLREFQKRRFLLIDLVPFPIHCFVPSMRAEVIDKGMETFLCKMNSLKLSASCNKLLILPFGTFEELKAKRVGRTRNIFEGLLQIVWVKMAYKMSNPPLFKRQI
jgi:hypothetical protein